MLDEQLLRYARHLMLPSWGVESQTQLMRSHVLVIGAGGLGSAALLYLASSGVGQITVMDPDVVDLSNLQRQIAHTTARMGVAKVDSAAQAMAALNHEVTIHPLPMRADAQTLPARVAEADLVLDCSDNFATRQAVNAACVHAGKPLVWASALGWSGQISACDPKASDGACYACVFPVEAPPPEVACATMGVLAPLVGILGSMQAAEALKQLAGCGGGLTNRLLMLDGQTMQWAEIATQRQAGCAVCGGEPSPTGS